jgi:hypothetical protein
MTNTSYFTDNLRKLNSLELRIICRIFSRKHKNVSVYKNLRVRFFDS